MAAGRKPHVRLRDDSSMVTTDDSDRLHQQNGISVAVRALEGSLGVEATGRKEPHCRKACGD